MRKRTAVSMGLFCAALLLGGCASNTADGTKNGSTAETKVASEASVETTDETPKNTEIQDAEQSGLEGTESVPAVSSSVAHQMSDTKETEDMQDSGDQETETQKMETSIGQAEFSSGTYVGDGESITLTEADGALEFSFAQAGITGTATIDGAAAVYSGDDDHQIEFRQDGTILEVTVTGAQGEESASPLAGTYVKEAD